MAFIGKKAFLSLPILATFAASESTAADMAYEASFHISKPRVDVEHLQNVVLEQPPFVLRLDREGVSTSKRPPTVAVVCSEVQPIDCEQTVVVSDIAAQFSGSSGRVVGKWTVTFGSDVTAEYGLTAGSRMSVRTQTGPSSPPQVSEIPFSVEPGNSTKVEGPFGMTLTVSVSR